MTTRNTGDNSTVGKRQAPKPKGTALKWSTADQLIQATPTDLDLADAAALWRLYAPAWARPLFDTKASSNG